MQRIRPLAIGWFTVLSITVFSAAHVWAQREVRREVASPRADAKVGAKEVDMPREAVAVLMPTQNSEVRGVITLSATREGVHLLGKVTGLTPGLHGFHIHQFGDLRDPAGKAAGGHFAPKGHKHGGPDDAEHHAGDLGNIRADEKGEAIVDIKAPWLKLHFVVGRAIVVHADEDDLKSQPSGDAGDRMAVGVIGLAQPAKRRPQ